MMVINLQLPRAEWGWVVSLWSRFKVALGQESWVPSVAGVIIYQAWNNL